MKMHKDSGNVASKTGLGSGTSAAQRLRPHSLRLKWKLPEGLCKWNQVLSKGGSFHVSLGEGNQFAFLGPSLAVLVLHPILERRSEPRPCRQVGKMFLVQLCSIFSKWKLGPFIGI